MRDWDQFLEETPWFLQPGDEVIVGEEQPWSRGGIAGLPRLSALLASATLTPISVSGKEYELLAWGPQSARQGWLCDPPVDANPGHVHSIHMDFWSVCGGIVESLREPESWWWLNHNEVLTTTASQMPFSDILAAYSWLWEDEGLTIPIQPNEYYVAAEEASENLTLVHRESGRVLLFAPDHDFTGVTTLPGCPEYSLLTFDDAYDIGAWIERSVFSWFQ